MKSEFYVGMELFWVPANRYHGVNGPVQVTKIGTKWISLSNGERCSGDLRVDGGQFDPHGSVWRSEQAYKDSMRADRAWSALQQAISGVSHYRRNRSVSAEDIEHAADLLGLKLQVKP